MEIEGEDDRTKFWQDSWIGHTPLRVIYADFLSEIDRGKFLHLKAIWLAFEAVSAFKNKPRKEPYVL